MIMDCYFAPMEGITGYVYRNAHHRFYGGIARYYTPFIAPNQSRRLTSREMNDILPKHNQNIPVVPQILTNRAEDFVWAAGKIRELGYQEVNLNLGCPSKTVTVKNRGAGFLAFPKELDCFLGQISKELQKMELQLSIKTRIGRDNPEEFVELLRIFNQYPLKTLIIHPRVQTDFYRNHPNLEVFADAVKRSENPVCYNGDIFSWKDYEIFEERFPSANTVMLGRGLLQNPALAEKIEQKAKDGGVGKADTSEEVRRLKDFHDAVLAGYREAIPGDRNVLFKMKELWSYLGCRFEGGERLLKKIKKATRMEDYKLAAEQMFAGCILRESLRPSRES